MPLSTIHFIMGGTGGGQGLSWPHGLNDGRIQKGAGIWWVRGALSLSLSLLGAYEKRFGVTGSIHPTFPTKYTWSLISFSLNSRTIILWKIIWCRQCTNLWRRRASPISPSWRSLTPARSSSFTGTRETFSPGSSTGKQALGNIIHRKEFIMSRQLRHWQLAQRIQFNNSVLFDPIKFLYFIYMSSLVH